MKKTLTVAGLLLSMVAGSQAAPLTFDKARFSPRSTVALFTPVAARCDNNSCQTRCYVENSRCQSRDGAGCSANLVSCTQACHDRCN